jgi:hypothetical protein
MVPIHAQKRNKPFHEPTNKDAAPTELEEGSRGVVGYEDGAPPELLKSVQGCNACAKRNKPFQEQTGQLVVSPRLEQCLQQQFHLFRNLGWVFHSLGDFAFDRLAKLAAEPMNRYFHCAFA